jgi:phosphoenolpyruvate carboxykinase (ATP)
MRDESLAGIERPGSVHHNPSVAELVELSLQHDEGALAANGAIVSSTGKHTGRSPKDRFIVAHGPSQDRIDWGAVNQPIEPERFDVLLDGARDYLEGHDLFVTDGYVGADPEHRLKVRVVNQLAWHALFARQLFRRLDATDFEVFDPDFEIITASGFKADPDRHGTRSDTFIGLDLERNKVLIVGSAYAGEMKKSMFTAANYLFPQEDILTMHCAANTENGEDVALFFGLSGTGKTTLSADPERRLIGDDEHAWSDNGVFNLEGGCYAKCINLSQENEPQIWNAIRFGSVVENVVIDETTREPDYDDASLTENTRAVYPLEYIDNFVPEGRAGHASSIVFLTADAFGVLPPVSVLTKEAAMYHFLSGFTAKLAGTEVGLGDEPQATFSACFGSPFLPLPARVYADMLGHRIEKHDAAVFLVNTGWTGGPFGVGQRMDLPTTRAVVRAAVSGRLAGVPTKRHPIFNLDFPVSCPGVPDEVLDPGSTWPDSSAYEEQARKLANMMAENFTRVAPSVPPEVIKAGPTPA